MSTRIRMLVIRRGHMGASHARAYARTDGFELGAPSGRRRDPLAAELGGVPIFNDAEHAIREMRPDAVSVNSYPATHARYTLAAFEAGAYVFFEKPLAITVDDAWMVVNRASERDRKVVVGYILRHHPSWTRFVTLARTMGKPMVMRMNLNRQSSGSEWANQKQLMRSMSPIVECGVHCLDIMCRMTGSRPIRCSVIGARLTEEINASMYDHGQLQVGFEDGSIGWYEAGWGPMMSETAYFVKDVVGPHGSVSIVARDRNGSSDVGSHPRTNRLLIHRGELDSNGALAIEDEEKADEPDHQELCDREQQFVQDAIRNDTDLSRDLEEAVRSLQIVLAADESARTGRTVELSRAAGPGEADDHSLAATTPTR